MEIKGSCFGPASASNKLLSGRVPGSTVNLLSPEKRGNTSVVNMAAKRHAGSFCEQKGSLAGGEGDEMVISGSSTVVPPYVGAFTVN